MSDAEDAVDVDAELADRLDRDEPSPGTDEVSGGFDDDWPAFAADELAETEARADRNDPIVQTYDVDTRYGPVYEEPYWPPEGLDEEAEIAWLSRRGGLTVDEIKAARRAEAETFANDPVQKRIDERERMRRVKRPDFVMVPRNAIRDPRLKLTRATVLALLAYLFQNDRRVAWARMGVWLRLSGSTVWRAFADLHRLGFVDACGRPVDDWEARLRPKRPAEGHLRLSFAEIERFGSLKKAADVKRASELPSLGRVRANADGSYSAPARFLSVVWGDASPKTVLRRLAGLAAETLSVVRRVGHHIRIKLLPLREQKPKPKRKAVAKKVAPPPPPASSVGPRDVPPPDFFDALTASLWKRGQAP